MKLTGDIDNSIQQHLLYNMYYLVFPHCQFGTSYLQRHFILQCHKKLQSLCPCHLFRQPCNYLENSRVPPEPEVRRTSYNDPFGDKLFKVRLYFPRNTGQIL